MAIDRIYLGTWLPRTHIHLKEVYEFIKNGYTPNLDQTQLKTFHRRLKPEKILYRNNPDFDSVDFTSGKVAVSVAEDGIIKLKIDEINNVNADLKEIESFHLNKFGPALAYLFSRGAPLPQTLLDITEFYPKILIGQNISQEEAEKIMNAQQSKLLTMNSAGGLTIFYGKDIEIFSVPKKDPAFELIITNAILIDSFSDLLRRFLVAHRNIWTDIDTIRKAKSIRYRDFPAIRNKVLDSSKTVSFIRTRLQQMTEILSARNAVITEGLKETLVKLGFEDFKVLESSSRYFDNLYQMTAEYAQSTLALFETLVAENTQREVRLLQQVTVIGALVGFFGMNIAFPWEERWPDIFISSLVVVGVVIIVAAIFYLIIKKIILNRRFNLSDGGNKK